jgi:hypothetical protein
LKNATFTWPRSLKRRVGSCLVSCLEAPSFHVDVLLCCSHCFLLRYLFGPCCWRPLGGRVSCGPWRGNVWYQHILVWRPLSSCCGSAARSCIAYQRSRGRLPKSSDNYVFFHASKESLSREFLQVDGCLQDKSTYPSPDRAESDCGSHFALAWVWKWHSQLDFNNIS